MTSKNNILRLPPNIRMVNVYLKDSGAPFWIYEDPDRYPKLAVVSNTMNIVIGEYEHSTTSVSFLEIYRFEEDFANALADEVCDWIKDMQETPEVQRVMRGTPE